MSRLCDALLQNCVAGVFKTNSDQAKVNELVVLVIRHIPWLILLVVCICIYQHRYIKMLHGILATICPYNGSKNVPYMKHVDAYGVYTFIYKHSVAA